MILIYLDKFMSTFQARSVQNNVTGIWIIFFRNSFDASMYSHGTIFVTSDNFWIGSVWIPWWFPALKVATNYTVPKTRGLWLFTIIISRYNNRNLVHSHIIPEKSVSAAIFGNESISCHVYIPVLIGPELNGAIQPLEYRKLKCKSPEP